MRSLFLWGGQWISFQNLLARINNIYWFLDQAVRAVFQYGKGALENQSAIFS